MAWTLRLIRTGPESEGPYTNVVEINLPHDLGHRANLGLTLSDAKLVLAGVQRAIGAAQIKDEAVQPPEMLRSPTSRQSRTKFRRPPRARRHARRYPPRAKRIRSGEICSARCTPLSRPLHQRLSHPGHPRRIGCQPPR